MARATTAIDRDSYRPSASCSVWSDSSSSAALSRCLESPLRSPGSPATHRSQWSDAGAATNPSCRVWPDVVDNWPPPYAPALLPESLGRSRCAAAAIALGVSMPLPRPTERRAGSVTSLDRSRRSLADLLVTASLRLCGSPLRGGAERLGRLLRNPLPVPSGDDRPHAGRRSEARQVGLLARPDSPSPRRGSSSQCCLVSAGELSARLHRSVSPCYAVGPRGRKLPSLTALQISCGLLPGPRRSGVAITPSFVARGFLSRPRAVARGCDESAMRRPRAGDRLPPSFVTLSTLAVAKRDRTRSRRSRPSRGWSPIIIDLGATCRSGRGGSLSVRRRLEHAGRDMNGRAVPGRTGLCGVWRDWRAGPVPRRLSAGSCSFDEPARLRDHRPRPDGSGPAGLLSGVDPRGRPREARIIAEFSRHRRAPRALAVGAGRGRSPPWNRVSRLSCGELSRRFGSGAVLHREPVRRRRRARADGCAPSLRRSRGFVDGMAIAVERGHAFFFFFFFFFRRCAARRRQRACAGPTVAARGGWSQRRSRCLCRSCCSRPAGHCRFRPVPMLLQPGVWSVPDLAISLLARRLYGSTAVAMWRQCGSGSPGDRERARARVGADHIDDGGHRHGAWSSRSPRCETC